MIVTDFKYKNHFFQLVNWFFFSYKTFLEIALKTQIQQDNKKVRAGPERLHRHWQRSTTRTKKLILDNFNNKCNSPVHHRLHCSHLNSTWVHLPVPGDVALKVSLGVSQWGQTSHSDTQDQRQVSWLRLDFRPHCVSVPREGHVGGGKQTFSLVVQVVGQAHAAQWHLPLPRHTPYLARRDSSVTRAAPERKSGQTCWVVRVLDPWWPYVPAAPDSATLQGCSSSSGRRDNPPASLQHEEHRHCNLGLLSITLFAHFETLQASHYNLSFPYWEFQLTIWS